MGLKRLPIMKNIKINKEQRLYVLPSSGGYSCLGFDVLFERSLKLANELEISEVPKRRGTKKACKFYYKLIRMAEEKYRKTGWRSQSQLIPEFIGNEGRRVEVVDCWGDKRRFNIGKSTGFIPSHLEIARRNSIGGPSVMGYPFQSITFLS